MSHAKVWTIGLLAVALSGCLGASDDVNDSNEPDEASAGDTSSGASAGTGSASDNTTSDGTLPGNGTADNETQAPGEGSEPVWRYDNRSGTLSGTSLIVSVPSEEETFDVFNGTLELAVDVGAEGTVLDVWIAGPDCDEESCADATGSTSSGNVTLRAPQPPEGGWLIHLEATDPGPVDADYTASIGFLEETMQ